MTTNLFSIKSNGKLLITGEYFVLDGALAFAIPTKYGQTLDIEEDLKEGLHWRSYDVNDNCWFEGHFSLPDLSMLSYSDLGIAQNLQHILSQAKNLNPKFLTSAKALKATTRLEFPRDWGLGSSSTLLYSIAKWAAIDPFELSSKTMGGSGYDIACAGNDTPILYQRKPELQVQAVEFTPPFTKSLYFVHLGKKQNSREGIKSYRAIGNEVFEQIDYITTITELLVQTIDLVAFEGLLLMHEKIVANTLKIPRAKDLYFKDFWGEVKSLGAWGGDFVLVTSDMGGEETKQYFVGKGFTTVIPYEELVLPRLKN